MNSTIGIDPGLSATGYAVLRDAKLVAWGQWEFDHCDDFERGELYCGALLRILDEHQPEVMGIETQFATMPGGAKAADSREARAMAHATERITVLRTQLTAEFRRWGREWNDGVARTILPIAPATGMKALIGHGPRRGATHNENRDAMLAMAKAAYGIDLLKKYEHIAYALGIALAAERRAKETEHAD